MAKFNDLAVELQEAIWELVLPQARGVHWVEVEGIPHEPDFVRESISMTEWHQFDRLPETHDAVYYASQRHPRFSKRAGQKTEESGPFFRKLLTTVPAVFGRAGPEGDGSDASMQMPFDRDDEVAYTRRCRQLSTYTQVSALLSTCRLSRLVAQQRIRDDSKCSWPLHRSMGPLYRPRPMSAWEARYGGDKAPPEATSDAETEGMGAEVLAPRIHALDLAVFRLYDSRGRATPLLRQAAWQYKVEASCHLTTFACLDRVGIEWHPSWASAGGRGELRPGNFQAFVRVMQGGHFPSYLYWLVDGVPRPDWDRDYPAVVRDVFEGRMAAERASVLGHLERHWDHQGAGERAAMLADHHLRQEFEANGRRYYIVFVVFTPFTRDVRRRLEDAGVGHRAPFPGRADMWPEAVREPARLAYDVMRDGSSSMGTYQTTSYILSWEPI